MKVSIGLPGATPADALRSLAPRIEAAGFHGLWLNDTPDGDALAGLAIAARATSTLHLGVGVAPLDRRPAREIADAVLALGLPQDRLTVGVGSGGPRGALARVGDGVALLRDALSAPVIVGALGPRMRALAAERADGVLLNWLTPAAAAAARDPRGSTVLYARTALDRADLPALDAEAARYGAAPAYAANFAREGFGPLDTVIRPGGLASAVRAYDVDELVLRAVAADPAAFVAAAAREL